MFSSINDTEFRPIWNNILRNNIDIDNLHKELFNLDFFNLDDTYIYNPEEYEIHEWEICNTPFKEALSEYEDRYYTRVFSDEEKEYFDQLFIYLSDKVNPTQIEINDMIYLGCSNKALEEIFKRYNGEPFKISFYPEMLMKSLEILIGFDSLDIENKVTIYSRNYGKSCEVLPIDSLIISYILHSLNDFHCDTKLDEIKDKINILKIYCSPSSFTKIKDFILYLENINIEFHKYSHLF